MKRQLLAIDPGLNSLGWAYWAPLRHPSLVPDRVGLIKAPRKLDLAARAVWIARSLEDECTMENRGQRFDIVSEFPAYHGSPMGWQTGDLQKLTFLVGVLAGFFDFAKFTPVTPGEWKGQLPKSVVIQRLQKRFGPGATRDWEKDVWDAVGIGLWKLGKF